MPANFEKLSSITIFTTDIILGWLMEIVKDMVKPNQG